MPDGAGEPPSGRPSSRPISRPSSRPATAVTNSAVESASTWRISQVAGHDRQVRQQREADDDPGDDPQRPAGRPRTGCRGRAPRRKRRARARRGPRARPRGGGYSGSMGPSAAVRRPPGRERPGRAVSLASPGRASPRGPGAVDERHLDRRRASVAASTTARPAPRAAAGPAGRRRGTIARPKPRRAASRSRRSSPTTPRSSPSSPTSPIATVPGAIGRSRSDEASARATGRSRPGSATDSPPARLA